MTLSRLISGVRDASSVLWTTDPGSEEPRVASPAEVAEALADELGMNLCAVLLGSGIADKTSELIQRGAEKVDRLLMLTQQALRPYEKSFMKIVSLASEVV